MASVSGNPVQEFPTLPKLCSHFSKILLTIANIKGGCEGKNGKIGHSIQGLVVKVKDTVAKG